MRFLAVDPEGTLEKGACARGEIVTAPYFARVLEAPDAKGAREMLNDLGEQFRDWRLFAQVDEE